MDGCGFCGFEKILCKDTIMCGWLWVHLKHKERGNASWVRPPGPAGCEEMCILVSHCESEEIEDVIGKQDHPPSNQFYMSVINCSSKFPLIPPPPFFYCYSHPRVPQLTPYTVHNLHLILPAFVACLVPIIICKRSKPRDTDWAAANTRTYICNPHFLIILRSKNTIITHT